MLRLTFAILAACAAASIHAQQPPAGAVVKSSEPGKVSVTEAVRVSAAVVAIDKIGRTVDLKGPKGRVVTLAVSNEVRNFDQVQVGDQVVVRYVRALSLELKKTGSAVMEKSEKSDAVRAPAGARPGAAGARQVTVLANVVAVNKKTKTITLKGPKGNQVDLVVEDPKQLALVKKGDQVEAVYTEAVAISVEAAPKSAAKSK
jgi:hypothetical protein